MSNLEISCLALQKILTKSRKQFVCPLCQTTWARADKLFNHCREIGKEVNDEMNEEEKQRCAIHSALGAVNKGGDFLAFRKSLAAACGQDRSEIPIEELPLELGQSGRRSYGACLGTIFIVKNMATSTATKLELLKRLLLNSGIHSACPSCWMGFADSNQVVTHCSVERDENHQRLLSKDLVLFAKQYGLLLECNVIPDHMEVDFDGYGVPDFRKCFRIVNILKTLKEKGSSEVA